MRPWIIFLIYLCAPSRLFSQNQGPSVAFAEPKAAASLTALVVWECSRPRDLGLFLANIIGPRRTTSCGSL